MKFIYIMLAVVAVGLSGCNHDSDETSSREIFIDHYKSECFGLALSLCMKSRYSTNEDWTLFYESIEGFNYEWGYSYKLRVNIENVENPPEDSSSLKYSLVDVLSKEKELTTTPFEIAASRSPDLVVNKSPGIYELYGEKEFSCSIQECSFIDSLVVQDLAILFEFIHSETSSEPLVLSQVKCSASRESFRDSCL